MAKMAGFENRIARIHEGVFLETEAQKTAICRPKADH